MNDEELARSLAFVAPERRALVERRLGILTGYLALDRPSMAHSRAAAAELGLTTAGFYRLVSVWRGSRDPALLDGIAGPSTGPQPSRFDDEAFIRTAIDEMPIGRSVEQDVENVLMAAERAKTKVRGRSTLRRFVTELRAEREAAGSIITGVLIDHTVLVIPVEGDAGQPIMPIATAVLAAEIGRRTLLSVRLALDAVCPATILKALGRAAAQGAFTADPKAPTDLTYVRGTGDEWDTVETRLTSVGISVRGGRVKTIKGGLGGTLIGPTLLGVRSKPGIVSQPPARRLLKIRKGDEVLSLCRAQILIDERLAFYKPGTPTPFSLDPMKLYDLVT